MSEPHAAITPAIQGREAALQRVEEVYRQKTPGSAKLVERAKNVLPGGNTRTTVHHAPYPLVFERGEGSWLWDVDGNRYFDLFYNGLSIIHGHAFGPVRYAIERQLRRGTALGSISSELVELASVLQRRIPAAERVRFTSSGTEAGMVAVRLARAFTGRPLILKATHAYHGSFYDLEAGLYGIGEIENRTILAAFNDAESFAQAMHRHGHSVAAIIIEPVMFTGRVVAPAEGFLAAIQTLARQHGSLFLIDDCLMLRLAEGGSSEKFAIDPDMVMLGKFLGGGTALGAVCGRAAVMDRLNPYTADSIFHGGSFNGVAMSAVAALTTLEHLDAYAIAKMDEHAGEIRRRLRVAVDELGIAAEVTGIGSIAGLSFFDDPVRHEENPGALGRGAEFHLHCLNNGVSIAPGGLMALATSADSDSTRQCIEGLERALADMVVCA